ncbi:MAG TPA: hypothetical protein VJT75_11710 [Thermoleophilaceae bacterium]|nr:hypothetical protein [Thermoleophilaceae bacterium]
MVSVAVVLFVSFWLTQSMESEGACGGSGGEPYAAPGSPQLGFCEHVYDHVSDLWTFVPPLVAALGAVLLVARNARWAYRALLALSLVLVFLPRIISGFLSNH